MKNILTKQDLNDLEYLMWYHKFNSLKMANEDRLIVLKLLKKLNKINDENEKHTTKI